MSNTSHCIAFFFHKKVKKRESVCVWGSIASLCKFRSSDMQISTFRSPGFHTGDFIGGTLSDDGTKSNLKWTTGKTFPVKYFKLRTWIHIRCVSVCQCVRVCHVTFSCGPSSVGEGMRIRFHHPAECPRQSTIFRVGVGVAWLDYANQLARSRRQHPRLGLPSVLSVSSTPSSGVRHNLIAI